MDTAEIVLESSVLLFPSNSEPKKFLQEAIKAAFDCYLVDCPPRLCGLNQHLSCPDSVRLLRMRLYWAHPTSEEHRAYAALAPLRLRLYSLVQPLMGAATVDEVLNRGKYILCDRISAPSLSPSEISCFNERYELVVCWTLFGAEGLDLESYCVSSQSTEPLFGLIRRLYDSMLLSIKASETGAAVAPDPRTKSEFEGDRETIFRLALCIHTINMVAELCYSFCREILHITPEHGPLSFPASSLSLFTLKNT